MTPCENNFNLSIKKCQEISIFVLIGKLWGVIQTIFFLVIAYTGFWLMYVQVGDFSVSMGLSKSH